MAQESTDDRPRAYRIGDLTLDLRAHTLKRGAQHLDLPDLSLRLLAALARGAPDSVSKDDLIRSVWGKVVVGDETLAQRIRLLRQALGDDSQNPRYVASVRGRGYRLVGTVTRLTSLPDALPGHPTPRMIVAAIASVVALALLATIALTVSRHPPAATEPGAAATGSLAVLPFADLSEGGDQQYLADGIHEELLGRLASVDGLAVTSRTSVLPYRSTPLGVPEIAAELGVDAILEGSVRLNGRQVRITAQLIDGETDRHLWADSYERTLSVENLFDIQTDIAGHIAAALSSGLAAEEPGRSVRLPTHNLQAYNLFLRGRFHIFRSTVDDLDQAISLLTQATQLDPQFANAYAALGSAYSFHGTTYGTMPPAVAFGQAKSAALTALALNPTLTEARSLYADILTWYDWDWAAAEDQYRQILRVQPDNVLGYALLLSVLRRHDEATALVERAVRRFPEDRFVRINAAWRFYNARDYPRAISEAQASVNHPDRLPVLGWSALATGKNALALEHFHSDLRQFGASPVRLSNLAVGLLRNDRHEEASAILQQLLELRGDESAGGQPVDATLIAAVYFEMGALDDGFALLHEALGKRMRSMIFLQIDHAYDGVRSDERYKRLVDTMGFSNAPATFESRKPSLDQQRPAGAAEFYSTPAGPGG